MPEINDILILFIPASVIIASVYFFIISPILIHRDHKKAMKKLEEETDDCEPEFVSVGARVLGKGGFNSYGGGSKTPSYHLLLRVAFLTDDGEELVFDVSQEIYDRISEGQRGNLITVNGNFFDFGDGEDIEEE